VPLEGTRVAVAGPPVAVTGVVVRSVTRVAVAVVVGMLVGGRVAEATGITAVGVAETEVKVGWAVKVCATAVLKSAPDVAAESTFGLVPGVGVKPGS